MKKFKSQAGFYLLEALVATLIFSIGIVGLVGIVGKFTTVQSDSQYRAVAANYATDIADAIFLNVPRSVSTGDIDAAALAAYMHAASGSKCSFSGSGSSKSLVTDWIDQVGKALPGSGSDKIQIKSSGYNRLDITICWQGPTDNAIRQHVYSAYVN